MIQNSTIKIGNYTIYQNQINAGNKYYDALISKQIPVLCSQPQMGKTGTIVYIVSKILQFCWDNNINNFKIYHNIYTSDKSVKDQTIEDYKKAFEPAGWAGFNPCDTFNAIEVVHRNDLKKIANTLNKETTYFFLSDESHIGLNENGLVSFLNEQIQKVGCDYYKGYCSATPFVYYIYQELLPQDKMVTIPLYPGASYYSVQDYRNDNRIKPSFPLFEKNNSGDFTFSYESSQIVNDFADKVKSFGHGFFIIRDTKKIFDNQECRDSLLQYIKYNHNIDCQFKDFNSNKNNIQDLEQKIKLGPPSNKSEIIIIKGSLRLGKRVHKQYIRCCLDTPSKSKPNAASVVQALLGRCCGNDVKKHLPYNTFNIYCNMNEINEYITWWNGTIYNFDPNLVPTSGWNKSNVERKDFYQWKLVKDNTHKDSLIQLYKSLGEKNTWTSYVSSYTSHDICEDILHGRKGGTQSSPFILLDSPCPNHGTKNWDKVFQEHPDWKPGDLIYRDPDVVNKTNVIKPTNDHLKKNIMSILKVT